MTVNAIFCVAGSIVAPSIARSPNEPASVVATGNDSSYVVPSTSQLGSKFGFEIDAVRVTGSYWMIGESGALSNKSRSRMPCRFIVSGLM
jgi:hypothetical protein